MDGGSYVNEERGGGGTGRLRERERREKGGSGGEGGEGGREGVRKGGREGPCKYTRPLRTVVSCVRVGHGQLQVKACMQRMLQQLEVAGDILLHYNLIICILPYSTELYTAIINTQRPCPLQVNNNTCNWDTPGWREHLNKQENSFPHHVFCRKN